MLAVRAFTSGSGGSGALGTGSYQNVAHDQSSCVSARPFFVGDLLDRDPGLLLPGDRVGQVPAVHRDEVLLVQAASVVQKRRLLDAPRQAHVVLAARAADGGELLVAVHVDLDFAFAPPLVGMEIADADHRADVAALVLSQGQQLEVLLRGRGVLAAEQHVQPADVVRRACRPGCR